MRYVIVLSDLGAGGTQRLVLGLAAHLIELGRAVDILTLETHGTNSFFPIPDGIHVRGLGLSSESRNSVSAVDANLARVAALRKTLQRITPDLVLSFLTSNNVLVLLATIGLRVPAIVTEESEPAYESTPHAWRLLRRLTYPRARYIVVHSQGARAFFRGPLARRVQVIANPVAPCPVKSPLGGEKAERLPIVAAMGRLSPEKGFDVLLLAFAHIARRCPEWSLIILGDGPEHPRLLRLAEDLGIAERVFLPGFHRSPAETFVRASIFCSAARVEGFGLALCEAMACGLPAVATDAPSGPRDIVRPGVDGELVPVDNAAALGEALVQLMDDPHRRAAYGVRARDVVARFSPTRIWADWDGLIDAAARRRA